MNRIYRSIWNETTGSYVAVSEHARSNSKKSSSGTTAMAGDARFALKGLTAALMLAFGSHVYAMPTGGAVSAGSASITDGAGKMTINQSSQNVAINWQSFNIGQTEAVRFVQPNSSSVALNRVLGSDPSSILGSLSANGKVFLVNPNGILFGKGAQVNVGGLVASTRNITDGDFMAGKYNFAGAGDGAILNQGSINADGGYVALLGAKVSNEGVIAARLGTVALAAGNAMTLDVAGDGLLNIAVNQGAVNALVQNGGMIRADGGQVLLTAKSAGDLLQSAVNNTGVIQAQSIENRNGMIRLLGDMQSGTVNVSGTLDASAPNGGNGGFIETSAANVNIANDAKITTAAPMGLTGTWLIDPQDFTIQAGFNISGATLSTLLGTNSVVITTNTGADTTVAGAPPVTTLNTAATGLGDINVNEAVTKANTGTTTTLTLNAFRDVNVNAVITTTFGNLVACCGRDINVNAAITTTDGSVTFNSGRDINVTAKMTTTRGNVVLRAGSDGTGPAGLIGGTVVLPTGANAYTVTGVVGTPVSVTVDYTPTSYATPKDYSGNFILTDAALTTHMLVFAQGNNKVYDGNTTATLSFKGDPALGGVVTLVSGTATFDDKNVASNIGISYTGYSLNGADVGKFALWNACTDVAGSGRTSAAITTRPMTLQANDDTKVYGQTFTPLSTAFTVPVPPVAGETVTNVTETSTGTVPTVSVAGSTYPIMITPGSATGAGGFVTTNYAITYVNGALTVTPAPLTVTANNNTKVYGQTFTPASTAFTTTALQNGETVGSVTEVSPAGTPVTAAVPGPYAITPSAAIGGTFAPANYAITYVNGALTVTPAPLTVTANNNTKVYGQTFTPASTAFTTTALQNGETVGSVTEVSPAGTPAIAAVPGPYAITPSAATGGTFAPANYAITYLNGALLVTPAPVPPIIVPPVVVVPSVAPPVVVVPPVEVVPPIVVVPPVVPLVVEVPPVVFVVPPVVPPDVVVPPVTPLVVEVPPVVLAAPALASIAPEAPQFLLAPELLPVQNRTGLTVVSPGVRMPLFAAYTQSPPPAVVPPPRVEIAPPVVAPPVIMPPPRPRRPDRN